VCGRYNLSRGSSLLPPYFAKIISTADILHPSHSEVGKVHSYVDGRYDGTLPTIRRRHSRRIGRPQIEKRVRQMRPTCISQLPPRWEKPQRWPTFSTLGSPRIAPSHSDSCRVISVLSPAGRDAGYSSSTQPSAYHYGIQCLGPRPRRISSALITPPCAVESDHRCTLSRLSHANPSSSPLAARCSFTAHVQQQYVGAAERQRIPP